LIAIFDRAVIKSHLGTETNVQKEIIQMLRTVIEQNHFQFDQEYCKQPNGLAMGAPTSILAETYIQYMEHTQIYPILIKQLIIAYFRYVDDILIIYDQNKTNIDHTIKEFNKLQSTINFTTEKEERESINFLDLVIHRNGKNSEIAIYQKPTQTDIIILNSSCYPYEHKLSGIIYLVNRLQTHPIMEKAKDAEISTIQNVLCNNDYDINLANYRPRKNKNNIHIPNHSKKVCAGKGQQHIQKIEPSSRQRGRPTQTRP
jgi:hypothetical protein